MILIVIVVCQSFIILNYKHQLKQQKEQLINQKQSEEPKLPIEEKVEKDKELPLETVEDIPKEAATYAEALSAAQTHNKNIFVYFGAKWCHNCVQFGQVIADKEVKEKLSKYIFVYVDIDKNRDLVRKYKISGVPYYAIINSKESIILEGKGYLNKESFLNWLQSKTNNFENPESTFLQPEQ